MFSEDVQDTVIAAFEPVYEYLLNSRLSRFVKCFVVIIIRWGKSGYFDSQTAREVPCLCMSGMSLMGDTFLNIYVVIGNDPVSMLKLSVLLYCLCSVFHIPKIALATNIKLTRS
ncbi:uncharacterized protein LOC134188064 isoform X2 [Corticium candelabrum]|uniref:uncharacterized protein LOC134188064 isoform X2 n=1 Tax=Corticium candelabrum TaxID=121492 RepID=UPI002E26068E|nr:uncharacterized protein LOC134188064 isoform X2 [Corticium candelabrum]